MRCARTQTDYCAYTPTTGIVLSCGRVAIDDASTQSTPGQVKRSRRRYAFRRGDRWARHSAIRSEPFAAVHLPETSTNKHPLLTKKLQRAKRVRGKGVPAPKRLGEACRALQQHHAGRAAHLLPLWWLPVELLLLLVQLLHHLLHLPRERLANGLVHLKDRHGKCAQTAHTYIPGRLCARQMMAGGNAR